MNTTQFVLTAIGSAFGAIVAFAVGLPHLRNLYRWRRPISVSVSVVLMSRGGGPDLIRAEVTNLSQETQYLVKCDARGINSVTYILGRHFRRPFVRPSLYPNIWYGSVVYSLMNSGPIKLEPNQKISLQCEMHNHPLNAMFNRYFFVKATLSSGVSRCSRRIDAPTRWRHLGSAVR